MGGVPLLLCALAGCPLPLELVPFGGACTEEGASARGQGRAPPLCGGGGTEAQTGVSRAVQEVTVPQSPSGQKHGLSQDPRCPPHPPKQSAERSVRESDGQAGRGRGWGGSFSCSSSSAQGPPAGPGRSLGGKAAGVGRPVSQQTGSGHLRAYVPLSSSSGIRASVSAPKGSGVGHPLPALAGPAPGTGACAVSSAVLALGPTPAGSRQPRSLSCAG